MRERSCANAANADVTGLSANTGGRHPWRAAESGSDSAPANGTSGSGKNSRSGSASSASGSASGPSRRPGPRPGRRPVPGVRRRDARRPAKSKPKATASASASATSSRGRGRRARDPLHVHDAAGSRVSRACRRPRRITTPAYTAAINTNLGKIGISLLNSKATCTVNSFVHLAETNFFNTTQCHRVSNSSGLYVLQCGDPTRHGEVEAVLLVRARLGPAGPGTNSPTKT